MNSKDVITEILRRNNFQNFKIKYVTGKKNSKCMYNKEKTTLYINENNNKDIANTLRVTAHEASHALNYREGVTNPVLLKFLEKMHNAFFIILVLAAAWNLLFRHLFYLVFPLQIVIPQILIYIIISLHCFFTFFHYIYYTRDEAKTEKRAIKELRRIWEDNQFSVAFKDIQERNKKVLYWSIYSVSILACLLLIGVPLLCLFYLIMWL